MKNTILTQTHIDLGAKMAPFAGYNMPIVYTNIKDEHMAVREHVGVFDVSHMGEFIVKGKQALDLVQLVTSNDASKLVPGEAQYSCLPNAEGGIVDDLLVYRLEENMCNADEQAFMLVVNASNIEKDFDWIEKHNKFDTRLINISDQSGLLAIQGPNTTEVLQTLTDVDLSEIKYYTFRRGTFAGVENVIISATGYTGSGGFELYVDNRHLKTLWEAIFDADKSGKIKPIGLGARDTLRLEMGFCLYGNDIDDQSSPLEAGLGWITKLAKENFVGQDIIQKKKADGLTKRLVAFEVADRRVPRQGYPILNEKGDEIGEVTSGTLSPCLEIPIGLGYVKMDYRKSETNIQIDTGRKKLQAKVVKLPFYKSE